MYKRIAGLGFALALLLGTAPLDAQVTLGLKAGVNVADLSSEDPTETFNTDTRSAIAFGGFAEFEMGDVFAFQPELLYSQKGAKVSEDGVDLTFKVNYVELPVLLKARVSPPASGVRPSFFVGPVFAFESKCEVEGTVDAMSATLDCDAFSEASEGEVDIQTKSMDLGVTLGAGIEIPAGGVVVVGDVRYTLGLTDVNDTPGEEDLDIKNRTWSMFAGIGFPVGL